MVKIALALIVLVAYLATLVCRPSKMNITFGKFQFHVKFTTKNKSGNA